MKMILMYHSRMTMTLKRNIRSCRLMSCLSTAIIDFHYSRPLRQFLMLNFCSIYFDTCSLSQGNCALDKRLMKILFRRVYRLPNRIDKLIMEIPSTRLFWWIKYSYWNFLCKIVVTRSWERDIKKNCVMLKIEKIN